MPFAAISTIDLSEALGGMPTVRDLQGLLSAEGTAVAAIVLGVGLVVGVAMLLWGRALHRALLVLAAGGVGLLLGAHYGPRIELNAFVAQLAGAVSFALIGLAAARVVWAALAGLHAAALAGTLMLVYFLGEPIAATQPAIPIAYGQGVAFQLADALRGHGLVLGSTVAGSGVAGAILAFLLPRTTVVVMTSLLGTWLLSTAIGLGIQLWVPVGEGGPAVGVEISVPAAVGLLGVGLLFQTFCEVRARWREASEDDGKDKKPAKSGGGDE